MKLIGIDPGYSRCGLAGATLLPGGARFDFVRVIETSKAEKGTGGSVVDDMRARMRIISLELAALCAADVIAICCEAGAVPFGQVRPSVVTGLGRARGLIDMLSAVMDLPVIEPSPQALKKLIAGKSSASKQEMQSAMEQRYPELRAMWPAKKTMHEHAADAAASIVAGLESEVVHQARGRRSR